MFFSARLSSLGDSLLQGGASGELDAEACGDLDLFAGAGVAAGACCTLDALDGEQAGHLDGLTLGQGLDQDILERTKGGVSVDLRDVGALGDLGNKFSAVDGQ